MNLWSLLSRGSRAPALAAVVNVVVGCGHTHKEAFPIPSPELVAMAEDVNEETTAVDYVPAPAAEAGARPYAGVTTLRGETYVGRHVVVVIDRQQKHTLPIEQVREIRKSDHLKGAIEGLLLGGLTGAATGALVGYYPERNTGFFDRKTTAALTAIALGAGAAIVGALLGAAVGDRSTWQLGDQDGARAIPQGTTTVFERREAFAPPPRLPPPWQTMPAQPSVPGHVSGSAL
jgi:hypothetical protein